MAILNKPKISKITKLEEDTRKLATELHKMGCHTEEGDNCTWEFEAWESTNVSSICVDSVKGKYLTKSQKLLKYFDKEEARRVLKFLRDINPKLALQLIKEL